MGFGLFFILFSPLYLFIYLVLGLVGSCLSSCWICVNNHETAVSYSLASTNLLTFAFYAKLIPTLPTKSAYSIFSGGVIL